MYSPPSPKLDVSGELKENSSVTLSCSAVTPCPHAPPKLSWNYTEEPVSTTNKYTDQTPVTKIQKTITLSDKHDGLSVKCSAEYPVKDSPKRAEENLLLNVIYSPKTYVSIHPSAPVPAASSVNLSCLSRANPCASQFTWYQRSSDGDTVVSRGQNYTVFNVTHTVVFFCVARNALGEGTSEEIQLWVSKQIYWLIVRGLVGSILLVCLMICVWTLRNSNTSMLHISVGSASCPREVEADVPCDQSDLQQTLATVDSSRQQAETVYAEVYVPISPTGST
ncbi:uncharacterized protein ACB058_001784 [Synchiropus picturatus]